MKFDWKDYNSDEEKKEAPTAPKLSEEVIEAAMTVKTPEEKFFEIRVEEESEELVDLAIKHSCSIEEAIQHAGSVSGENVNPAIDAIRQEIHKEAVKLAKEKVKSMGSAVLDNMNELIKLDIKAPSPEDNLAAARENLANLDVAPGLEELEMGAARVEVDDKAMINCRADLNQLVPFKYDWAWQNYLTGCENHWMPQEVRLENDVNQYAEGKLSEPQIKALKNIAGAYGLNGQLMANNRTLALYRLITNPECRQYLLRQGVEESTHQLAFQHVVNCFGIKPEEALPEHIAMNSVQIKHSWTNMLFENLDDADFKTGSEADDQKLLKALIGYYLVGKGLFGYANTMQVFSAGKEGSLKETVGLFSRVIKDTELQIKQGIYMINTIKVENPNLWTNEFAEEIIQMVLEGAEIESRYYEESMPEVIGNTSAESMSNFFKVLCDVRLKAIGLPGQYESIKDNSINWMIQEIKSAGDAHAVTTKQQTSSASISWE